MTERHHILFDKRSYEATNDLLELRRDPRLIVPLDHDTHRELHQSVSHVPPLSRYIARSALYNFLQFDYTDDGVEAIDQLQLSIDRALKHPRADVIEKSVGNAALLSLELQKPFIDPTRGTRIIDLGKYRAA